MLTIKVDVEATLASLQRIRSEQIPYAVSRALNESAYQARDALVSKVQSTFRFKTGGGWVRGDRGWFILSKGRKESPTAFISTNPQHSYMYLYQESGLGGVHRPRVGKYLAVPLGNLQKRLIPPDLRPKAVMASGFGFIVGAGDSRFIAVRSSKKFALGGVIATGKRYAGLQLLYVLLPMVKVQGAKIVDLESIVRATVAKVFPEAMRVEMENAIRTAH